MVSNLVGGDAAMIELEQLVAGYDGVAITPPLSGMICPGSLTAIVGLNGCGKSTLLKTLAGFLPPVSGRLRWQGKRPVIGWLAQRHALESQFPLNVQDVVSQGAWPGVSLLRGLGGGTRRRIGAVLERVGLAGLAKTPIEALSGGQFQRMLFARVMVQQAPLVMLDEPFTGIDEATSRELMDLILEMHRQGQTILAVLHDNQRVAAFSRDAAADSPARLLGRYPGGAPGLQSCEVGMIWHTFFQPFIEFGFMRRALVVCLALSLSTTMLGVFLLLRRMSLMGDALSHAILPGVAVGYLLSGMSLLAMTLGGFIAGIVVALVAGWVSRRTPLKEDASFAGFYLGSLALGVTLVSLRGSSVDLLHLLFGSILAVDRDAALFVSGVASLTLLCIALCYRGLVSEAFDSAWLQVNHRRLPALLHGLFLALLVLNLVAGFQVLGTLMAVGVMMLPAVAARCWARTLPGILLLAAGMGALCAWLGLSFSWAISLPAGPAIVLTASALFFVSLFFGTRSRLLVGWRTLMG